MIDNPTDQYQISQEDFIKFCETDNYGKKLNEELCKLIHVKQIIGEEDHPIYIMASEMFQEFIMELLKTIEEKGWALKC